jgi:coproporphyrinogen III oxidase-like Fe-S oxidoreductase
LAVPQVLATLDRTHRPESVARGVKAAKKVGLACSVDLIYGTPGESVAGWRAAFEAALDPQASHAIGQLTTDGLLTQANGRITLTRSGRLLADTGTRALAT